MEDFKKGDRIWLKDEESSSCCNLRDWIKKNMVKALVITGSYGDRVEWKVTFKDGMDAGTCCTLYFSEIKKVDQRSIMSLYDLTDEQKAGLSKDDQALIERGIIGNTLQLQDSGYVVNFLFRANKEAIAAQAAKEVAVEKKRQQPK